jgi:hypothetical protein
MMDYVPPDDAPIESQQYLVEWQAQYDESDRMLTAFRGSVAQTTPIYEAYISWIREIQSPCAPKEVARLITLMAEESPSKAVTAYRTATYGEEDHRSIHNWGSHKTENTVDVTVVVPRAQMVGELWAPFGTESFFDAMKEHYPYYVSPLAPILGYVPIPLAPIVASEPIVPLSELAAQCQASGITTGQIQVVWDDNFSVVVNQVELACTTNTPAKPAADELHDSWVERFVQDNPWIVILTVPALHMISGAFQELGKDLKTTIVELLHRRRAEAEYKRPRQDSGADGWPQEMKELELRVRQLEAELDNVIKQKGMAISDPGDQDLTVLAHDEETAVHVRLDHGIPDNAFRELEAAVRLADNRRAIAYNEQLQQWHLPD